MLVVGVADVGLREDHCLRELTHLWVRELHDPPPASIRAQSWAGRSTCGQPCVLDQGRRSSVRALRIALKHTHTLSLLAWHALEQCGLRAQPHVFKAQEAAPRPAPHIPPPITHRAPLHRPLPPAASVALNQPLLWASAVAALTFHAMQSMRSRGRAHCMPQSMRRKAHTRAMQATHRMPFCSQAEHFDTCSFSAQAPAAFAQRAQPYAGSAPSLLPPSSSHTHTHTNAFSHLHKHIHTPAIPPSHSHHPHASARTHTPLHAPICLCTHPHASASTLTPLHAPTRLRTHPRAHL